MSSRRWLLCAAGGALAVTGACGGGDLPWSPSTRGDTASVSLALCANPLPIFFAHQNEEASWSRVVSDAAGTFAFNAAEAVATVTNALSIGGLNAAETTSVHNFFWTPSTSPQVYVTSHANIASSPHTITSVPASITQPGDVHTLSVDAWSNGNTTL